MITNLHELAKSIPDFDAPEEEKNNWCRLVKVYFDAQYNPPEGVIGVGAITYAEQCLKEAQNENL